ncbi:MAG: hypothetical protein ACEQSR_00515 [Candidatus Methylacidiphilales bacterium]
MKQKLKLLLSITTMLFIFKGCKPDQKCDESINYKYIYDYDISKIPYKDFSVLTFLDKKTGDTLIFTGGGYQSGFDSYSTAEECPKQFKLQRMFIVFQCNKNTDQIVVSNFFEAPNVTKINFSYKNNNKTVFPGSISWPFSYDSINIEGKYYHNIEDFTTINSTVDIGFLYNLNEGIIKLIYPPTKDTLNLINIQL